MSRPAQSGWLDQGSWHVLCAHAQLVVSVPHRLLCIPSMAVCSSGYGSQEGIRSSPIVGGDEESREKSQNTICVGIVWCVVPLSR